MDPTYRNEDTLRRLNAVYADSEVRMDTPWVGYDKTFREEDERDDD